jgi:hypothetical protein
LGVIVDSLLWNRPISIKIGTASLALPFAISFGGMFLAGQFHPSTLLFVVFGFLPLFFALYRLFMRDKVARVLVTIMAVCAIGFSAYIAVQFYSFEVSQELQEMGATDGASLIVVAASQMGEGVRRNGTISTAFALCLSLGLVAVYLPTSNRWFREGSIDR